MSRTDVTFPSGDDSCTAWLYTPDNAPAPGPIIVMAHGLGGVRQMRLDAFAGRFSAAGYRCLVFDYRHFGASGGEPRQLLSVRRQLEDWQSAITYAKHVDGADPDRMILWGTSFGGGHVIRTAARTPGIAAVIAQCPFTDGLASTFALQPLTLAKVAGLAARDLLAALRKKEPVMIPAYGEPGSPALMTAPDSVAGIEALIPPRDETPSDITARFGADIVRYFSPGATPGTSRAPRTSPSARAIRSPRRGPRCGMSARPRRARCGCSPAGISTSTSARISSTTSPSNWTSSRPTSRLPSTGSESRGRRGAPNVTGPGDYALRT